MKKFIVMLALTGISFGQIESASSLENNILSVKLIKTQENLSFLKNDYNGDGNYEIITGSRIVKTDENEYWINNAKLKSSDGSEIIFGNRLYANNRQVISQVNSDYGYIVIFENGSNTIEVYIADVNGAKNSDVILLNY